MTQTEKTKSVRIKRGLDLNIKGSPKIDKLGVVAIEKKSARHVAILGDDYPGMKPTFLVKEGDKVQKGQALFTDKKNPRVQYTAKAAGKIIAIHRGAKRAFESVVIEVDAIEKELQFKSYTARALEKAKREDIVQNLLDSGLWTSIIARPYGKVANPESQPSSLFINAMDTEPHAPPPEFIIEHYDKAFALGVKVLSRLADKTFLIKKENSTLPHFDEVENISFSGPHPAGLSGTHIHFLDPVYKDKTVWSVRYADVIAIGELFQTGKLHDERVIAITGPKASYPRLVRTRAGADLNQILQDEFEGENVRVVSGSLLSGRTASNAFAYLGHFHNQVSLISEDIERQFLGWLSPGLNKFSIKNTFLSAFANKAKEWNFTTALNGSHRSIVPIGSYEKIMPLDMEPTFLLRAMLSNDLELAENLGVLELIEEDMSLLTFVSPTKDNFSLDLRRILTEIEKEG